MKAITQIIEYLRGRGELSRVDLEGLTRHGFLPWEEFFGADDESQPAREASGEEVSSGDERGAGDETPWRPRRGAAKRGRAVVHKGRVLHAPALCTRLAKRFDEWRADLEGLRRVACRLEPCGSWEEAAVAIRNRRAEDVFRAVREGVDRGDPALTALLRAIDMDRYREVVDIRGLHGPAVAAYRAIVASSDLAALGKHAWLLRRREVRHVFNLRAAQERLCLAWLLVREERPGLFANGIGLGRAVD
jgi:hypothetical protein